MNVLPSDRFAMYLRKSRADVELEAMGQGETLARHRDMLNALAERQQIATSQITVYKEVVSGESIDARPEMQKLLSDVWQRKYTGVLVVEVERLARGNTKDQGEVANAFQYSNTLIITPAKIYDPQNEFDQEYFEFGLFMSRREYKTIRRRLEAGKLASVKEGNFIGSKPPYGYDILRTSKHDRTLVINEEQAKIVRMIYNWFTVDHLPAGTISYRLTGMGLPTPTGGKEWGRSTIQRILRNPQYIGKISWNEYPCSKEYSDGELRKSRKRNSDMMLVDGKHEAIISEEQYNYAQTLWKGTVPVQAMNTVKNPLAGLLFCARCGYAMKRMGESEKSKEVYHHYHVKTCDQKSVHADIIIHALTESLKLEIEDCEITIANDDNADADKQTLIDTLKKSIEQEERKREKLFDAFESDIYTKDEFLNRKQLSEQKIAALKEQLQEAMSIVIVDREEKIYTLHQAIGYLENKNVSAKEKNLFLKQFISRIDFDRVGDKIVLDVQYL